tara:strand:+ start:1047 stop:2972 length:1926 start_codon:yes stop_codon:yes gene_type:complete
MGEIVNIMLPDGSKKVFEGPTTGAEVASSIGPGLAKSALAAVVNGVEWDLTRRIEQDSSVSIITRDSDEALALLRHDCAHVLAEAVQEIWPDVQVTIGPPIENGFYYDFARETPFTLEDLLEIEERMSEIIARDEVFTREVWDRERAIKFFKENREDYKVKIIEDLPFDEEITIYRQGDWLDLCRGPHSQSTGKIGKAFKLTKLAGAYWRGDSSNEQLQRIYGTCWRSEKELKTYLHMLDEAEKRDHRRLGSEMDLFHQQEEASGSVFWHPKGWTIYREIQAYMRRRLETENYIEVKTPQLIDRSLWECSGHWDKFQESMFIAESEGRMLAVKPMNCPGHVQIFKRGVTSYRDLPIRMAEFGSCHRNEPSGALHGLMRVRAFTQDDAHIFCTEDQIVEETKSFCNLLKAVYSDFGFDQVSVKFASRPEVRAGEDAVWERAETALIEATEAANLEYKLNPGEGAFYGPKLEFVLKDAIGREWQCGTLQVDFVMPARLDASYIGSDGDKHRPVMLHRAILGSFERFIAILIENFAGKFPFWLAPTQVIIATITSDANDYADKVLEACAAAGLRAETDLRNEKINYKVREHSHAKVPILFVLGKREADEGTVAIRRLGGKQQEVLALTDAITRLTIEALPPDAE